MEKFRYYAFGKPAVVESDQKPLGAIFRKHVASVPFHIARVLLRIQKYDAQIKYVSGKDIPVSSYHSGVVQELYVSVHKVFLHLNASPARLGHIQEETAKDLTLSALREVIMSGWPEKRYDYHAYLNAHWNYRYELTVADGFILKRPRIIIPKSLQPDVLQQLHYAQQ